LHSIAQQAVTYARDRSFEREAVTDERELYRDALRRGMSETTYSEVRAGFEARIAVGEFQLVPGQKHDSGRSFTTPETIRSEKEIIRRMQQGQGRAEQIMSIQAAVAHTQKQQHLNVGQRAAAEEILTSRDVVQGLEGRAGVGKTTLLKSVREAAEKRGYVVEGFAPTSRAANQLRDAGISADTLQGFLVRTRQPGADRHLYMLDESSLASTKQVRDFLAKLESNDRVLLIGDTRQHQGVEAGKPFEQLVNAGMKTAQLDQIVRQRASPELLKAVEHLSRGEVAEGVALLEQQGRVTEIADAPQRIAAIARSYAASPDNTIVVSPDNASRRQINQAVRSELQALGTVAAEDHTMRVLAIRGTCVQFDVFSHTSLACTSSVSGDLLRTFRATFQCLFLSASSRLPHHFVGLVAELAGDLPMSGQHLGGRVNLLAVAGGVRGDLRGLRPLIPGLFQVLAYLLAARAGSI
jgi:ATP-dependent exoDNAse (exonuclease V) alpha subunit